MRQETDYVKHHIQKVVAFFPRCATFTPLQSKGHQAVYFQINANSNPNDLQKIINSCIEKYNIEKI
jgi:deoxyribodipyrimidine photolyase-related protein